MQIILIEQSLCDDYQASVLVKFIVGHRYWVSVAIILHWCNTSTYVSKSSGISEMTCRDSSYGTFLYNGLNTTENKAELPVGCLYQLIIWTPI